MLGGTGGGEGVGRVVVGVSVHSVLCFSGACVIPGLAWPLQSQRLAFSLDSHHGLSVRLAQSQQAWTTDHRGCALKSCLDTAQSTMASCICLQITKVAFSLSSGPVRDLRPPSILSSRITEFPPSQRLILWFHTIKRQTLNTCALYCKPLHSYRAVADARKQRCSAMR